MAQRSIITENKESRSVVWRSIPADGWVYKRQMKTLCDNEMWCYEQLAGCGFVPKAERVDLETIRTEDLGTDMRVLNPDYFLGKMPDILAVLKETHIRHGDLTEYSVLVRDNLFPCLIDFAESRIGDDPRPDKRPEGDAHWLAKTMRKRAVHNQRAPEIWAAINTFIEPGALRGKFVLDVGCGHGDMLLYTANAGAMVCGLDIDADIVEATRSRTAGVKGINVQHANALDWLGKWDRSKRLFDMVLCLSVLPYLNMEEALKLLHKVAKHTVIECQYAGDGPGTVSGNKEMRALLEAHWSHVETIGRTHVRDRDKWRDIWRCS